MSPSYLSNSTVWWLHPLVTTPWLQCDQILPLSVKGVACETRLCIRLLRAFMWRWPFQPQHGQGARFTSLACTLSNLTVNNTLQCREAVSCRVKLLLQSLKQKNRICWMAETRRISDILAVTSIFPLTSDFTGLNTVGPNVSTKWNYRH